MKPPAQCTKTLDGAMLRYRECAGSPVRIPSKLLFDDSDVVDALAHSGERSINVTQPLTARYLGIKG